MSLRDVDDVEQYDVAILDERDVPVPIEDEHALVVDPTKGTEIPESVVICENGVLYGFTEPAGLHTTSRIFPNVIAYERVLIAENFNE